MKRYEVVLAPAAHAEGLDAAGYIAQFSLAAAAKWYKGLEEAINSLDRLPRRCGSARETEALGLELRQLLYHSHRIIFRVEESNQIVRILHIRHVAQRTIGEEER